MKSPHLLISSHPLVQTHMHARTHARTKLGRENSLFIRYKALGLNLSPGKREAGTPS